MPIFASIGTAIAGALFSGSLLAGKLIAGALAFGTQLLIQSLTRQPKRTYSAVQSEARFGADVPVSVLYGTGPTTGHLLDYFKWGAGNKFNAYVLTLADGWCDGLEPEIYFGGEKHSLVARTIIGNEIEHWGVDGYGDLVSIRFYDGRPGQGPDAKLVADTAGLGRTWQSTSVAANKCYVVAELQWDAEKFGNSLPELMFVLRGLREYDPTKDSTVAGGSGPHRLDNPSTWQHSHNPALHRINHQLGVVRGLISGQVLVGEGKSLGQLDLGSYFAAIAACDTLRLDGKKRYQCSLWVTADDDHKEVLDSFDDAMCGYAMNRRGLSGVIAGAPQIPVADITADDIDLGRPKQLKLRRRAFELFNTMSGQFTSPESHWRPESLKTVWVNADVAADGRRRRTAKDFLQVTDPDLAQYCLNVRYRQNRKGASATLPVSRRLGFKVQEGEWVTYLGRTWLVTGWKLDARLRVTLVLAETGADVYADEDIPPGPIVIPPTPPVNPSLLSTVQNFNVEVGNIEGAGGHEVPALRFSWTPPSDPSITAVRFEYFIGIDPTGQPIYRDETAEAEAGEYLTAKDVQPGVQYSARATIRTVPDRLKTWTPWAFTATATGPFQVYPPGLIADIEQFVAEREQWILEESPLAIQITDNAAAIIAEAAARIYDASSLADRFRQTQDQLDSVALVIAEQDYANWEDKQQLRRELRLESGNITAAYTEAITVATGPGSAIAVRFEALEAEAGQLGAAISTESLARVQGDEALANQLLLISAGSNNQFDWAKIWYFDGGVEGWTGNGSPSAANGWLKPASHASDPYVVSPESITAAASSYRQVRLRIRKTGAPTWEGYLWWREPEDATWDAARRVAFDEPVDYDGNGIANVTINPEWSGTIDRIRVDLASASDASNFFEIDWIAVGRPAPGASMAALLAEQTARIMADSALAADITTLLAEINDLDGAVAGQAVVISSLQGSVSTLEGGLTTAQGQIDNIVGVQLPGKASTTALATLEAEVAALGGGGVVAQGTIVSAIRSELEYLGGLIAEGQFDTLQGDQRVRLAVADAYQTLDTKVTAVDEKTEINAQAIIGVSAALGDKVEVNAFSALAVTVTEQGNALSSVGTAVTTIQNTLPGKADVTALNSLQTQVNSVETLAGTKNRVFRQGTAPTALAVGDVWFHTGENNRLYRASATGSGSWVLSEDQRVPALETTTAAQATSIQDLFVSLGGETNQTRIKMEAMSGPTGYSRLGLIAKTSGTLAERAASMFIDVPNLSSLPTRILFNVNQLIATDGSNNSQPFVFEGGTLKTSAVIAAWAQIASLVTNNFVAAEANIGNLTVDTIKIKNGAVTANASASGSGSSSVTNSWVDVCSVTIDNISGNSVLIQLSFNLVHSTVGSSGGGSGGVRLVRAGNESNVLYGGGTGTAGGGQTASFGDTPLRMETQPVAGSSTYKLQVARVVGDGTTTVTTASMFVTYNKK